MNKNKLSQVLCLFKTKPLLKKVFYNVFYKIYVFEQTEHVVI